jgi:hypothetical protein
VAVALTVLLAAAGVLLLAVGASELAHGIASRRYLGRPDIPAGARITEVIVVLGRPSRRDGRVHPAQAWRTRIAVRSMATRPFPDVSRSPEAGASPEPGPPAAGPGPQDASPATHPGHVASLLIFSGGVTRAAAAAEAATMARYAREVLGVPDEMIVEETQARTTRENLAYAAPQLEAAQVIKVVSDPLHAARARRYLRQTYPGLHRRVTAADDYRPFERAGQKLLSSAYELARPVLRHIAPRLELRRRRTRSY